MNNISTYPSKLNYTQIAPVNFAIAPGGPGWLNTDMSAAVPSIARFVAFTLNAGSPLGATPGIRPTGSAIDGRFPATAIAYQSVFAIVPNTGAGHFDCYQVAAGSQNYQVVGYFT